MKWFKKEKKDEEVENIKSFIYTSIKNAYMIYTDVVYLKSTEYGDLVVKPNTIKGDFCDKVIEIISIIGYVTEDDIVGFSLEKNPFEGSYTFRYGKINIKTHQKDKDEKEYNRLKPYIEKYLKENEQ